MKDRFTVFFIIFTCALALGYLSTDLIYIHFDLANKGSAIIFTMLSVGWMLVLAIVNAILGLWVELFVERQKCQ